jgi:protein TonB
MLGSNLDIMGPQWTDLIFKNRNQAYGAYELRKQNSRTTNRAMMIALGIFVLVISMPTIVNAIRGFVPKADPVYKETVIKLIPPPPIATVPPPPVLPERQVIAHNSTVIFPPPIVRPDPEAHQEPPTDKALEQADPGQKTLHGDEGAPVNIDDNVGTEKIDGVTEHKAEDNTPFVAVEVAPVFPGGEEAFGKFLHDHIRYPAVAKENGTQGRAFIQFIVERDGSLTDLKILRDPGSGLGEEAVRVLKISPHWRPGIQNGKPVRVQYTVPINFSLAD